MKAFMDKDFLLSTETSKKLFHPEQTWVKEFKNLLLEMKKVKDKAVAQEKEAVSYYYLHKFDKRYDEIIQQAYEENPLPESTSFFI